MSAVGLEQSVRRIDTSGVCVLPVIVILVVYVNPVPATEQNYSQVAANWFNNFHQVFKPPSQYGTFFTMKQSITKLRLPFIEKKFKIIWNVPSFQCYKYGLDFSNVQKWGVTQNYGDTFRGEKIALLYDPGLFPALLETNSGSDSIQRNGGVPQEGNITEHLRIFTEHVKKLVANDFTGVGVIDFEHWRPVWSENFGKLNSYREISRKIEFSRHELWNSSEVEREATKRFEKAGWQFFRRTLHTAKKLRPNALWGYYGFPLCFNYTPKNQQSTCTTTVMDDNDRIKWLFEESSAIYPSLYCKRYGMNENTRALFIEGRMSEAMRVSSMSSTSPSPVYPYTWLKYYDTKDFVTQNDLITSFIVPMKKGAAGVIIWGASNDVNTGEKCKALYEYVETILGPTAQQILKAPIYKISTFYGNNNVERPDVDIGNNNGVDYMFK